MEFLGENGWPAPRLKDVELTKKSYHRIYHRLIRLLRDMYQKCRLVHGDLSEYNLLYGYFIELSNLVAITRRMFGLLMFLSQLKLTIQMLFIFYVMIVRM